MKCKHWTVGRFVVGGVTVGLERAVILVGARMPEGLAYVGAVEGFSQAQLAGILTGVRARESSPFAGWAPRAMYLEPELVVGVWYLAPGPGLRHATLVASSWDNGQLVAAVDRQNECNDTGAPPLGAVVLYTTAL